MTHPSELSVEGLVERLRRSIDTMEMTGFSAEANRATIHVTRARQVSAVLTEAADTLTRLSRELEEAREALAGAHTAARHIMPYLTWTIGPESPGHHPTMPSAVAAFKEAFPAISAQPTRAARLSQEADRG